MTTEEEAFLEAIRQSPEDVPLRLIYADWLEEQGDPRSAAVRAEVAHLERHIVEQRREKAREVVRVARRQRLERWRRRGLSPYLVVSVAVAVVVFVVAFSATELSYRRLGHPVYLVRTSSWCLAVPAALIGLFSSYALVPALLRRLIGARHYTEFRTLCEPACADRNEIARRYVALGLILAMGVCLVMSAGQYTLLTETSMVWCCCPFAPADARSYEDVEGIYSWADDKREVHYGIYFHDGTLWPTLPVVPLGGPTNAEWVGYVARRTALPIRPVAAWKDIPHRQ
jgi:uncharacterized protein (TIGR02996 family)